MVSSGSSVAAASMDHAHRLGQLVVYGRKLAPRNRFSKNGGDHEPTLRTIKAAPGPRWPPRFDGDSGAAEGQRAVGKRAELRAFKRDFAGELARQAGGLRRRFDLQCANQPYERRGRTHRLAQQAALRQRDV
jgi:hypothetical protein